MVESLAPPQRQSQTQLGQKLGVHQKQISGYEREVHVPSTDVVLRMARLFDVSLDYLAFDDRPDIKPGVQIADRDLLERLEAIDKLSEHDKTTVKAVLDTFILKNRFQQLAGGEGERAAASG